MILVLFVLTAKTESICKKDENSALLKTNGLTEHWRWLGKGISLLKTKYSHCWKKKKKHHNKQTTCTQTPETAKFPVRICFSLIGRERSVGGVASSFSQTEGLWGWTRGGWRLCNIRRHICSVCTGISKLKNLFLKKRLKTVLWLKLISLAWKDRLLLLSVWCLNQSNLILLLFSVLLCQHC